MWQTLLLLILSNLFMTFAWYGHLKHLRGQPLIIAIVASWAIAFAEYCFQVPANRIGINSLSLPQLKVMQEVITMVVFAGFAVVYMGVPITRNLLWAGLCLAGSAYFIFKDGLPVR
ncbi:MAG: DMT family protein [Nitrospinae bacterium]|nr:DMT family protein [Nitrospinota bacterium]